MRKGIDGLATLIQDSFELDPLSVLHLIEVSETRAIPQERYKYEMKQNLSIAIGSVKTYFIRSFMS